MIPFGYLFRLISYMTISAYKRFNDTEKASDFFHEFQLPSEVMQILLITQICQIQLESVCYFYLLKISKLAVKIIISQKGRFLSLFRCSNYSQSSPSQAPAWEGGMYFLFSYFLFSCFLFSYFLFSYFLFSCFLFSVFYLSDRQELSPDGYIPLSGPKIHHGEFST
jgi:hypothetical protein